MLIPGTLKVLDHQHEGAAAVVPPWDDDAVEDLDLGSFGRVRPQSRRPPRARHRPRVTDKRKPKERYPIATSAISKGRGGLQR